MTNRFAVRTELAPKASGPYSQAIVSDNLIFTAGQIPIDPATGKLVTGDFKERVMQVLRNVNGILSGAGSSLDCAVKLTVYMTDLSKLGELNQVLRRLFKDEPPARTSVEVSRLPLGADIEIDCIAVVRG
ncbi:MAG: Rid family detoxifying hydrolase [Candidatus Neomarinimicrobiota bacterium]